MSKQQTATKEAVKVNGFFRLQITEDTEKGVEVVGDSGWQKNQVTNLGFRDYLVDALLNNSPISVSHIALGSGAAPAAGDTSLAGEIMSSTERGAVSTSIVSSKTAQFTAGFASSDTFLTIASNLSNVDLFNSSATGTLFSGNTYASSSCNTNQNVNVTYQIRFS